MPDGHHRSRALDEEALVETFTGSLDPKVILSSLVEKTRNILRATRCSVVRLDPERHPGKAFVFTAADDPSIEGYRLDLDDYPEIRAAVAEDRPIIVRDDPEDLIAAEIRRVHRKLPFPLSVLLPLSYRGENFGVLFLRFSDLDHEVRWEEIGLCQLIAFGAAVALHNARDHEDTIADLRSREHELGQLEEAHTLRMEMLSAAAHDLRAPLNSVFGYVDLLSEGSYGTVTDEQKQILGYIADNAENLLQIVNSVVDYARLEEGNVPLQLGEGEVSRLLEELRIVVEPIARRRGLELEIVGSGPLPKARTDWSKLQRILLNLLHNALKFTDEGRISLSAEMEGERIRFRVTDTGQGIEPESLQTIFDRFTRLDPGREEGPGGLGLSIVKRYTEVLGGEVTVESEPGKGSSFTVTVPVETASTP